MTLSFISFSLFHLFIYLLGQLKGPCVLQVLKIRNVTAPKEHEESQAAPRMLRLQMTDGQTACTGLEFKRLSKIR